MYFWPLSALAAPLDPLAYTSLGTLAATVPVSVDTDTLLMTAGAVEVTGELAGDVAVFVFDDVDLQAELTVVGARPFALLSHNDLLVGAIIGASADRAVAGPGGWAGATQNGVDGGGPGGGVGTAQGAGGGGHGGAGGASSSGVAGGAAYGDPRLRLQGGSGGGRSRDGSGGGGGGAVELGAVGTLSIAPTGGVRVNGGLARDSFAQDGGGGGAGGSVYLHAAVIQCEGALSAKGGDGGGSSNIGTSSGGGGGGGIIAVSGKVNGACDVNVDGGAGGVQLLAQGARGADGTVVVGELDFDGDGFTGAADCDDTNPDVNPDADEVPCNDIDDDCSATTPDEGCHSAALWHSYHSGYVDPGPDPDPDPDPDPTDGGGDDEPGSSDDGGCGCVSFGSGSSSWMLPAALLVARRRRSR